MIGWLTAKVGAEWAARIVIIVIALALLAITGTLAYCTGHHDGKQGEVVDEQARTIKVQQQQGVVNEQAAEQRTKDAVTAIQQQQELDNAIDNTNGDLTRQQRGCVILREQGRDTSRIPACSGSAGHP